MTTLYAYLAAVHCHLAAVTGDDVADNVEAQTGALSGVLGRKKRIENLPEQ